MIRPAFVTVVTPLEVRVKGETSDTLVQDYPVGMTFALNDRVLVAAVDGRLTILQKVVSA